MTTVDRVPDWFQSAVSGCIPNLRAFARSLARNVDDADDLVQDTLIKAFRNADRFAQGSNIKAWLFTILRNTHISNIRKSHREVFRDDQSGALEVAVPESQTHHMDQLDFSVALEKLPASQREALLLVGAEGFSYEDAALMCGCAVGTMKSRVNRARTKLAELLNLDDTASERSADDKDSAADTPSDSSLSRPCSSPAITIKR